MVDEATRRVWISIPPVMPPPQLDDQLERGRVELDLLAHPEAVIQQVGNAAFAPRPARFRRPMLALLTGSELDLACLEMPIECGEPESSPFSADHAAGTVPMARHTNHSTRHLPHRSWIAAELADVANSDGATVGIVGDLTEEALRRPRLFRIRVR